tara:strand:+ start:2217 stop:3101 length:885 start_codon:yes stop_codon:yes gene_type:complete
MVDEQNPLKQYFRQPSVHISLPSGGKHWPKDSLQLDESGEIPVYPMTAKDEMLLNTPDALMNGSATVDVIHSCCPAIKNAWHMPVMDLDTILIGIRIASYGETMDAKVTVPKINESQEVQIDLRVMMDQIDKSAFEDMFALSNGLVVRLKPFSYKQLTDIQLRTYEEQRLISTVGSSNLTAEEKSAKYTEIFSNMTKLTLTNMMDSIHSIKVDGKEVVNPLHIQEFVQNMTSKIAGEIREKISGQNKLGQIKPVKVKALDEHVAKGAPAEFESPITLDNSNFFASRFLRSRSLT